jgi:hypothetical protein
VVVAPRGQPPTRPADAQTLLLALTAHGVASLLSSYADTVRDVLGGGKLNADGCVTASWWRR